MTGWDDRVEAPLALAHGVRVGITILVQPLSASSTSDCAPDTSTSLAASIASTSS